LLEAADEGEEEEEEEEEGLFTISPADLFTCTPTMYMSSCM
jgi:hypothetical protein